MVEGKLDDGVRSDELDEAEGEVEGDSEGKARLPKKKVAVLLGYPIYFAPEMYRFDRVLDIVEQDTQACKCKLFFSQSRAGRKCIETSMCWLIFVH